jgi:EmrB/QacA subfamily drug resistance transporter
MSQNDPEVKAVNTAPPTAEEEIGRRHKWAVLLTVAIGVFMATLDGSIVNLSLPTLSEAFGVSLSTIEWVVLSYLLIVTSTLLTLGRLSDMVGRKLIYTIGFVIFTVGSGLCGAALSAPTLIAFRAIQGLGAAMIFAIGPAIITDAFPASERGKALGLIGTTVAVGSSTGPTLGGVLLSLLGWRSIFLINLPVGIAAVVLCLRILPSKGRSGRGQFDTAGSALFFSGIVALLLALTWGPEWGWAERPVISLLVVAVVLIAAFLLWEGRFPAPMLNLSLLKNRLFAASLVAGFLFFTALSANYFIMPFYLQTVLGYPSWQVGLTLIAGSITLSVSSPLGGMLSDRLGFRGPASLGMAIVALGLLLMSMLNDSWRAIDVAWRLMILGLGGGLFNPPNNSALMGSVAPTYRGIASGLLAFVRNLGLVSGTAIGGAIWISGRIAYGRANGVAPESAAAQLSGMRITYAVMIALVAIGIITSLIRGRVEKAGKATRPEGATKP